jgi:Fur family ferric uptake transcriptional regulator
MNVQQRQQHFHEYLVRSGLKATRQRDLIARAFFATSSHISAESLYRRVNGRDRRIGLVTVYRTLKLLKDAGLAHERQFGEGRALFEHATKRHHDHMICTHCGRITEFENCEIEELQEQVARRFGFTLRDHKLELYGLCQECGKTAGRGTARTRSIGMR